MDSKQRVVNAISPPSSPRMNDKHRLQDLNDDDVDGDESGLLSRVLSRVSWVQIKLN